MVGNLLLFLRALEQTAAETGQAIHLDKSSTWTQEKVRINKSFVAGMGHPWSEVFTVRLKCAISQLMGGQDRWAEFGIGWWVFTFPGYAEKPWGLAGHWHVDGSNFIHHLNRSFFSCLLHVSICLTCVFSFATIPSRLQPGARAAAYIFVL